MTGYENIFTLDILSNTFWEIHLEHFGGFASHPQTSHESLMHLKMLYVKQRVILAHKVLCE